MHLRVRISAIIVCATLTSMLIMPSAATEPSLWDRVKTTGSEIYQSAKAAAPGAIEHGKELAGAAADKASDLYDTAKEKAPEVIDQTKAAASDAINYAKEKAPEVISQAKDGLQNAGEQFSDFRADQQDQFEQWFNGQVYYYQPEGEAQTSADPTISNPADTGTGSSAPTTTMPSANPNDPATTDQQAGTADANQPVNSDTNDSTPIYHSVEQGDDYVIVDGERYEKTNNEEDSNDFWSFIRQNPTKFFSCMALLVILIVIILWLIFWFKEVRPLNKKIKSRQKKC